MPFSETFRRRHLPHWDVPGATYFITACLEGSIPAQGLADIRTYEAALAHRPRPEGMSEADWAVHCWKLKFVRAERWLDHQPAVGHLVKPELAKIVAEALLFFAGTRCEVPAFVVMPSHFHWVVRPLESWYETLEPDPQQRTPRARLTHSIKSYTSGQCNQWLGVAGRFWQQESYDHWARDVDELERIIHYVEYNPVKAGLVADARDWLYGSAHYRLRLGLELGEPLPPGTVG